MIQSRNADPDGLVNSIRDLIPAVNTNLTRIALISGHSHLFRVRQLSNRPYMTASMAKQARMAMAGQVYDSIEVTPPAGFSSAPGDLITGLPSRAPTWLSDDDVASNQEDNVSVGQESVVDDSIENSCSDIEGRESPTQLSDDDAGSNEDDDGSIGQESIMDDSVDDSCPNVKGRGNSFVDEALTASDEHSLKMPIDPGEPIEQSWLAGFYTWWIFGGSKATQEDAVLARREGGDSEQDEASSDSDSFYSAEEPMLDL